MSWTATAASLNPCPIAARNRSIGAVPRVELALQSGGWGDGWRVIQAGTGLRCAEEWAHLNRARQPKTMPEPRARRRRAGRPPAGARDGEKVKDYPQLSIRLPYEMKARLNALSAVTGLAQWRLVVEAIDCVMKDLSPTDRELVDGLSARLMRVG